LPQTDLEKADNLRKNKIACIPRRYEGLQTMPRRYRRGEYDRPDQAVILLFFHIYTFSASLI